MLNETVQSATALELGAAILQQIPRDMPQEVALGWIRNKKALGKGLREVLMPPVVTQVPAFPTPVITKYNLPVDYDRFIEEARRAGRYNVEYPGITSENFPTTRKGVVDVEIHVAHFDRKFSSSEEAIAELDNLGLRLGEAHELLALGEVQPKLQLEFPIVALGSVWRDRDGNCSVLYLDGCGSVRSLRLVWLIYEWGPTCRFIAVPK